MATSSHCCIRAVAVSSSAIQSNNNKPCSEARILNKVPLPSARNALTLPRSSLLDSEPIGSLHNNEIRRLSHRHFSSQSVSRKASAVVAMAGSEGSALPVLNELPLLSYINKQGYIIPPVEPDTAATVFAIFDMNKKIQYIGFSKDVRNSLRTLIGRRPELCYYYKLHNLNSLDQQAMIAIRQQWFSEIGIPPAGNTDNIQRSYWEKPTDAGSISERGKAAAANSKAKTLLQMMVDRGLKEEMIYDPDLIAKGQCDVLPSTAQSVESSAASALEEAEESGRRRAVKVEAPSGEIVEFDIFIENKYVTNGGWMYDVLIFKDDKETRHRVVCGKIYTEVSGMSEDRFLERLFGLLLYIKTPRRTEGVLAINQFAANYFSVSEVAQKFDLFAEWFGSDMPDSYWRFNRIFSYGNKTAPGSEGGLPAELTFPKY